MNRKGLIEPILSKKNAVFFIITILFLSSVVLISLKVINNKKYEQLAIKEKQLVHSKTIEWTTAATFSIGRKWEPVWLPPNQPFFRIDAPANETLLVNTLPLREIFEQVDGKLFKNGIQAKWPKNIPPGYGIFLKTKNGKSIDVTILNGK